MENLLRLSLNRDMNPNPWIKLFRLVAIAM